MYSYSPSYLCEIFSDVMLAAVVLHMYTCVTIHIIIVHAYTHASHCTCTYNNNVVVVSSLAMIRYCDNQLALMSVNSVVNRPLMNNSMSTCEECLHYKASFTFIFVHMTSHNVYLCYLCTCIYLKSGKLHGNSIHVLFLHGI